MEDNGISRLNPRLAGLLIDPSSLLSHELLRPGKPPARPSRLCRLQWPDLIMRRDYSRYASVALYAKASLLHLWAQYWKRPPSCRIDRTIAAPLLDSPHERGKTYACERHQSADMKWRTMFKSSIHEAREKKVCINASKDGVVGSRQ